MSDKSWEKAKWIFGQALKLTPAERLHFLDEACKGNDEIRREVESLLSSYNDNESFMEKPAVGEVIEIIAAEQNKLKTGKCFGHYEIIKQIGAGGMGKVYLAKDKKLDRKVAIKILNEKFAKQESNLNRFTQEAKAASALNHPNILVIHEIGESEEANYIVSEFVEGETLREHFRQSQLKLLEILDIAFQIANALTIAHAAHIIHRDIKPENIMVRPDGYLKILDFGLAKLIEQKTIGFEDEATLIEQQVASFGVETIKQNETAKGVIMGTVAYMSPEQAKGEPVDERTDIFSLGAVIYEMVTGKTPFGGNSASEAFANLINPETPPLECFDSSVPDEFQQIITKMLCKNKNQRYQTMKDLFADLRDLRESLAFDERLIKSDVYYLENATKQFRATTGNTEKQTTKKSHSFSQQIKNNPQFAAIALIILFISAISFGYYFWSVRKTTLIADGKKTIAILPFVNTSQNADTEYQAVGITEHLINSLSQLSGLKVMAKHSVFRFKGKENELKKIADELGVQNLVTGDIKYDGSQLIINVHLIDPNDGSQIWGDKFVKNASDVITMQNEIAHLIAQNLRLNLTVAEKQQLSDRPTENAAAYQLYLKGRFIGQQITPDALFKSIELSLQAVEKDPNFALAFSDLGMRYMNLGIYFLPPREMMPKAKIYANKSLEINNTLSDPHVILGTIALFYEWDWDKAREELTVGNALSLESIETFNCAAHALQATGRTTEADAALRRALEYDPLSISLNTELGCNSYYAQRYDESINQYREAKSLEPGNFMAIYGLARSLNYKKQYQEAINEIETAKTFMPMLPPIAIAEKGYSFAKMGKRIEAEKELKSLEESSQKIYVDPFFMATIYLGLGDKEQCITWLEKAFEAKSTLIPSLVNDAKWDEIRYEERFQNLLNRLGVLTNTL